MCSIGDDYQDEVENDMEKLDIVKVEKTCNKCREQKSNVLLRGKHGYCKSCFLIGTEHKFKAFLGKHRFIRKDDYVLVNYNLGHPITSLLHFLRSGIDIKTPKQLKFKPIIFYIERNYHLSVEDRRCLLENVNNQIKRFNFNIYFVSFLEYVETSEIRLKINFGDIPLGTDDLNKINRICNEKVTPTIRTELYKQFERRLLIGSAKKLGCRHVFMCDLAVDVASQILTNVSLGRGTYLEMDIGICDSRDNDVNIIKPLRFFDIKELVFYNHFNDLIPIVIREDQVDPYSSVQNLMVNFVQNLQTNFPSTITTVVKTGDKLSMDKGISNNRKCELCSLPIEDRNSRLTSAEATDFSHWLSTFQPGLEDQSPKDITKP
ncbi:cytoplasmic trna 2-thiolation protein 2 [Holotrichia oblita]|uniref:Cytoplasmic trna 2-thiolation protein 2 n=1 Tax=Holotrichia oblita TaxID=644536 RepID=A0ACB9T111_HOLOL|nr:cytoplasmic trna 2-thiolation protein 2 [Holotrichia oblita]